jgi:hypothetical protein
MEETNEQIMASVTEKWGTTHYIDKLPIPKNGLVDLDTLWDNQFLLYGDGKTYYFRLTKKPSAK